MVKTNIVNEDIVVLRMIRYIDWPGILLPCVQPEHLIPTSSPLSVDTEALCSRESCTYTCSISIFIYVSVDASAACLLVVDGWVAAFLLASVLPVVSSRAL